MKQRIPRNKRWGCWVLFSISAIGIVGCGKTATVKGKVSYQGRPVTHGSVIFLSADKTARSGAVKPDGSYAVEKVPPGPAKIAVISRDPSKGRSSVPDENRDDIAKSKKGKQHSTVTGWFPLPRQFENPDTSGLTCTVASGRVSHDIELK